MQLIDRFINTHLLTLHVLKNSFKIIYDFIVVINCFISKRALNCWYQWDKWCYSPWIGTFKKRTLCFVTMSKLREHNLVININSQSFDFMLTLTIHFLDFACVLILFLHKREKCYYLLHLLIFLNFHLNRWKSLYCSSYNWPVLFLHVDYDGAKFEIKFLLRGYDDEDQKRSVRRK